MTRAWARRRRSYSVNMYPDYDDEADVIIVGYYTGSEAEPKIDFLHNHSLLCKLDAVKHAPQICRVASRHESAQRSKHAGGSIQRTKEDPDLIRWIVRLSDTGAVNTAAMRGRQACARLL